jgi:hypothetical protein
MREILLNPNATTEQKYKLWRRDMPKALSDSEVLHYMKLAAKRLNAPMEKTQELDEGDNPNYFGAGGGSQSAIPGTPASVADTLSFKQRARLAKYQAREKVKMKKFMQHRD